MGRSLCLYPPHVFFTPCIARIHECLALEVMQDCFQLNIVSLMHVHSLLLSDMWNMLVQGLWNLFMNTTWFTFYSVWLSSCKKISKIAPTTQCACCCGCCQKWKNSPNSTAICITELNSISFLLIHLLWHERWRYNLMELNVGKVILIGNFSYQKILLNSYYHFLVYCSWGCLLI